MTINPSENAVFIPRKYCKYPECMQFFFLEMSPSSLLLSVPIHLLLMVIFNTINCDSTLQF